MNANDIINQVHENCSEWIEMSDNPDRFVSGVLANKILKLNDYISYLEKRLQHDARFSNSSH